MVLSFSSFVTWQWLSSEFNCITSRKWSSWFRSRGWQSWNDSLENERTTLTYTFKRRLLIFSIYYVGYQSWIQSFLLIHLLKLFLKSLVLTKFTQNKDVCIHKYLWFRRGQASNINDSLFRHFLFSYIENNLLHCEKH